MRARRRAGAGARRRGRAAAERAGLFRGVLASVVALGGCGSDGGPLDGVASFRIEIVKVHGAAPPDAAAPLPANRGDTVEEWEFLIQARSPTGYPTPFDGVVRLSVEPGTVLSVTPEGEEPSLGRNIRVRGGVAAGTAAVTAVYGPARLWAEDIGYDPAPRARRDAGEPPACSNGENDDPGDDVLVDFPADPGCAFADDDSEEGGTHAAGNSQPVHYALPRIADVQGEGSETPYPFESIEINTAGPRPVVVTRVASDGFYVTDLSGEGSGYNHLFAFSFSTPPNLRVCDRVVYLAGTVNEFFGFTELSFPSYQVDFVHAGEACEVPEPTVLGPAHLADPNAMERLESGLVRVEGYHISKSFGPRPARNNVFGPDQSSCDLNGDGQLDFASPAEARCANACSADPECSEWTSFLSRGNYKVSNGRAMIQIHTGTVSSFDPPSHRGEVIEAVTGTLRNFSGGSLNWTIEARCPDDLVCDLPGCARRPMSSAQACVRLRTEGDDDAETN